MKSLLLAVVGLAAAFSVSANAQTTVYGGTAAGTAFTYTDAQHYLEDFTISSTGQLNTLALAINFAGLSGASPLQAVQLQFYTGVNTSAAAPDALSTAINIFGAIVTLPTAVNGDSVYTLNLSSLNQVLTAGTNYGLAVSLIQTSSAPSGFEYSDFSNGRFSNVAPSPGTNVLTNKVWLDGVNGGLGASPANGSFDNVFAGAEQSTLAPSTAANIRMSITVVPEPSALVFSAIAGCVVLGSVIRMRKPVLSA